MATRVLSLHEKVFVVKNYYQMSDMFEVHQSFNRRYKHETKEDLIANFFKLIAQFEMTGSVQLLNIPLDGTAAEVQTPSESPKRAKAEPTRRESPRKAKERPPVNDSVEEYTLQEDIEPGSSQEIPKPGGEIEEIFIEVQEPQNDTTEWTMDDEIDPKREDTVVLDTEVQLYEVDETEERDQEEYNPEEDEPQNSSPDSDEDYAPKQKKPKKVESKKTGSSPQPQSQIECVECKEQFPNRTVLRAHAKKEHSGSNVICETCGMAFRFPSYLRAHMRTHTKEKPMKCGVCGESFAYYQKLQSHMRVHGEGIFKCILCEKSFAYKNDLHAHSRKEHPRKLAENKPYVCHVCKRACPTGNALKSHMKILHKIERTLEEIEELNLVNRPGKIVLQEETNP